LPAGPMGRSMRRCRARQRHTRAAWFPPRSVPCRACGSCRATDPRSPLRQSAVAIATPLAD
jgi:hypothetical protein